MSYIDLKLWVSNPVLTKVYKVSKENSLQIHTPFWIMIYLNMF